MAKNVILFGAGASYGSDNLGVPPLGNKLFDKLVIFNPKGWGSLSDKYKIIFREDFEKGMVELSDERPHDLPVLQRAMAAFFFGFQPRDTNLYYKLANFIKQHSKDVTLATLNYERLLEISFLAAGHNLIIGRQPSNKEVELIFPHGCCHLFCESVRAMAGAVSFAGLNVSVNGDIKIVSNPEEFNKRIVTDAFPPVMSYFEPQKRATSGQQFLIDQRERFKQIMLGADRLIVIGVRIREQDSHIWDPIKTFKGRFIYCSGKSEKAIFDSWVFNNRPNTNNVFIEGYWGDKFSEVFDQLV